MMNSRFATRDFSFETLLAQVVCLLCALSYSLFYEKESAREKKSPMSRDVCVGKKHVSYGYVRLTRD